MPFFGHLQPPQGPTTMFDHYIAKMLFTIVIRASPGRTWKKMKWAEQIRLLRNDQNQDTDLIESVAIWLTSNWKSKNILPTSAKWFRSNFGWISKRASDSPLPPKMELTPIVTKILAQTKKLTWPKGMPEDFQVFVQTTEANYIVFKNKLRDLYNKRNEYPKLRSLIEHLFRSFPAVETFVMRWIERTHKRLSTWAEWSGKMMPFVFTEKSKELYMQGTGLTMQYNGGSHSGWHRVIDTMNEIQS